MSARLAPGIFLGRSVRTSSVADLTLTDIRYTSGAARHHHERAYVSLVRRGEYAETYGRRTRVCRPGLVVFHPPGESHAQTLRTLDVSALNIELGPGWLRWMHEDGLPIDQPVESDDHELAGLVIQLLPPRGRAAVPAPLVVESLTAEILARIGRRVTPREQPRPTWIRDVRELLDADSTRTPALGAIAASAGVHPMHLAQSFRRFYGCSIGEHLRRRRLEAARRQMLMTHRPLAEIAVEAGFSDQSHFTRTFKRFTGLTPHRYRTLLTCKTRAT